MTTPKKKKQPQPIMRRLRSTLENVMAACQHVIEVMDDAETNTDDIDELVSAIDDVELHFKSDVHDLVVDARQALDDHVAKVVALENKLFGG